MDNLNTGTLADIAQDILTHYRLPHQIWVGMDNLVIRVKTNSAGLVEDLRQYYRELINLSCESILIYVIAVDQITLALNFQVKEPDSGNTGIKEEFLDTQHPKVNPGSLMSIGKSPISGMVRRRHVMVDSLLRSDGAPNVNTMS